MSETDARQSPSPPDAEVLKQSFDRFVEVSKARITVALFLGLVTVTVTGFAVQNKAANLFFLAALVPLLACYVDIMMKHYYGVVFIYKAAMLELKLGIPEPTSILFLTFTAGLDSRLCDILRLSDEKERRKRFRSAYVWSGLGRRLFVYGGASLGEIALGVWAKYTFP